MKATFILAMLAFSSMGFANTIKKSAETAFVGNQDEEVSTQPCCWRVADRYLRMWENNQRNLGIEPDIIDSYNIYQASYNGCVSGGGTPGSDC